MSTYSSVTGHRIHLLHSTCLRSLWVELIREGKDEKKESMDVKVPGEAARKTNCSETLLRAALRGLDS
jgi:hypothetical protein